MQNNKFKNTFKIISYVVCVLLLIALIILPLKPLSWIFMTDSTFMHHDSLYYQPKDSIDVLCVGSSRIYCNVDPSVMWSEYGVASYNLATGAQPLDMAYYAIKEALKNQHPKVVVVDVSICYTRDQIAAELETMCFQLGMKYSPIQMQALSDHADKDHFMEYLLRFPCYHKDYETLKKDNFRKLDYHEFPKTGAAGFKGKVNNVFDAHPEELPAEISYMYDEAETERYEILEKINNLCNENGVPLMLILTPSCCHTEYRAVEKFAADYGVNYVNFMKILDLIGFDSATDFQDQVHLNYYGAGKVARFLSEFVMREYGVQSHAGDPVYASWDEYAQYVKLQENNYYLAKETGLGNYFNYIPNPNYVVITSLKGFYNTMDVGQRSVLAKLGCNDVAYEMGGTWVLDGSKLKYYYTPDCEEKEWIADMGGTNIRIIERKEDNPDNQALAQEYGLTLKKDVDIYINGKEFYISNEQGERVDNGIQFIVYDKLSDEIVDAAIFDSLHDYMIVRNNNND